MLISLKKILFYIAGACTLLIPAFYNGYPLVYSDTGSYLFGGMELILPPDRPIMYGLFVRFFSLGFSLWLAVLIQAVIVFYILWKLFVLAAKSNASKGFFIISIALLSWFTGLGWYTSQLMPDIFTITSLGVVILLLFNKKYTLFQNIIFGMILVFSLNTHFSNYLIVLGTIGLLFFLVWKKFPDFKTSIRFRIPLLIAVLAIAVGSITNYAIGNTFEVSPNSHVFLMGKMLDSGVLKSYLDDNCATQKLSLCDCKNNLPETSRNLLWDAESPLQKNGSWKDSKAAYNDILLGISTSPKHLSLFLFNSVNSSITQLFQNEVGSGVVSTWYSESTSPPYQAVAKYYPWELNQYRQSRQNVNLWGQGLDLSFINYINFILLLISVVIISRAFILSTIKTKYPIEAQIVIYVLLIGIIVNAIVTASLANVYDRLQARVSWSLIFCLLILFAYHKGTIKNKVMSLLKA